MGSRVQKNILDKNSFCLVPWDSKFWGFPVGKVKGNTLNQKKRQDLLQWHALNKIRCIYFAAEGSDAETLRQAYLAGFQFVDVRVDLQLDKNSVRWSKNEDPDLRRVRKKEIPALQRIAKKAHCNTRFFKDLNFNPCKCKELYANWIKKDFELNNVLGFFPKNQKNGKGYITFKLENKDCGRIELIAVDKNFQNQGIAKRLIDKATKIIFKDMGAKRIRVATQITNLRALKMYNRAGFVVQDVKIWYHKWS
jgi:dTDP-4-amino-4,6-dideoxy-D-galactose acyltransferase